MQGLHILANPYPSENLPKTHDTQTENLTKCFCNNLLAFFWSIVWCKPFLIAVRHDFDDSNPGMHCGQIMRVGLLSLTPFGICTTTTDAAWQIEEHAAN